MFFCLLAYLASSAVLATVSPADETSRPTPSTVLQAETSIAPARAAHAMILRINSLQNTGPEGSWR